MIVDDSVVARTVLARIASDDGACEVAGAVADVPAALEFLATETVDVILLASLLAGSIPGIVLGSIIASRVTDRLLTPILATTLAVVGLKLIF